MTRVLRRSTGDMSIAHRRPSVSAGAPASRPGPFARMLVRVLEGPHEWGELETWGGRYGCTSSCLVVYPPGTMRAERIRFRVMRIWPPVGLLLGFVALLVVAQAASFIAALVAGVAVYGLGALGTALLAGPRRRDIRTLRACRGIDGAVDFDRGPVEEVEYFAAVLMLAERRYRAGDLAAVQFEAACGDVWRELGAPRFSRP